MWNPKIWDEVQTRLIPLKKSILNAACSVLKEIILSIYLFSSFQNGFLGKKSHWIKCTAHGHSIRVSPCKSPVAPSDCLSGCLFTSQTPLGLFPCFVSIFDWPDVLYCSSISNTVSPKMSNQTSNYEQITQSSVIMTQG